MNKIEIFLPLPGKTPALIEYFTHPNVHYVFGLPVGPELYDDDLDEKELLEIALEVAQDQINKIHGFDEYTASDEHPFIAELHNKQGEHIAWEFEFDVFDSVFKNHSD